MKVLIVEGDEALGAAWARHLEREGCRVTVVAGQQGAIDVLRHRAVQVIVMNLVLREGSALAVADFASYKHPETKVIFVTDTGFFSDGSIFAIAPNACAYLPMQTPPDDLAAMVAYHGGGLQAEAGPGLEAVRH
ncbi:response regulator transcription factor [Vannielia litorea]|uniref:Response regulator receiver domain-containing protein n=1 Tax=Vannielia litorea TaxID=1217970 RepID=A0A1N6IIQ1_9RHOB|nr:response regulator [Vannielia litorea]SIO31853.1 Response regulator receiver domain-containing protein [Vannielia litorea]